MAGSGDSAGGWRRREEKAGDFGLAGDFGFGGRFRVWRESRSFFVCRQRRNSSEFSF